MDAHDLQMSRIRRAPALRCLPEADVERLVARAELRVFKRGEVLLREHTPASEVYLLLEGSVAIAKRDGEAAERTIATRGQADWVGESAVLDPGERSASVVAETQVQALWIPKSVFLDVVTQHPAALLDLLRTLTRRLSESDSQLLAALRREVRELRSTNRELSRENHRLCVVLEQRESIDSFLGRSRAACDIRALAHKVAESDVPVLLQGETGTGKELLARAIHGASSRARRPFVAVNCALLTEPLLESELFGHARGAFTGATQAKRGLVEEADGGTLLLDEVGDMPPALQGAVLRFVELGEFRHLGETRVRHANVRVIAATHRSLDESVQAGSFRRDLLYRLDVLRLSISPLRDRRDDLPLLIAHYIESVADRLGVEPLRLTQGALDSLLTYDFPGNVRELENEIERLYVILEPGARVTPEALSPKTAPVEPMPSGRYSDALREFKVRLVERALRDTHGNRTRAAEQLGVHRSNLVRMMRDLGVHAPPDTRRRRPPELSA